jgi:hypothetical protein
MNSTALPTRSYAPSQPQAVGVALRGLTAAARQVVTALSAALQHRDAPSARALTPTQEAERVREMAGSYLKTDPGFAADLFAAADRYERAHSL